ncbi:MAG: PD40 domain-containing protein [Candidatus Latescibacteria bacterium]|nr:PD40 domain-containing protein [Candidatus Latescibacterota bacterium]
MGVPLTVSNITSSDGQFSASPKSFTVPVGGGQDVTVTFTPASLGVKYATLAVSSNDPNAPTARLTVNGTAVVSDLQIAGKIAFASDRDGNQEIYTMNADGTGLTRLTSHDFVDYNPSWSPDGNRIAFRSQRTGNGDIYAVNEDGSGLTRLTSHPAADGLPSWSPDGAKIAFISNRDGNLNFDIHTMNADGSGVTRLTSDGALDTDPSWSPNGMKIVFTSFRTGNGDIYVMDPDGSGQNRRTFDEAHDGEPAWSPDLTQIAFMSRRTGNGDIYVMNADGTGVTRLTSDSAFDGEPAWSPDGKKIAFRSDRDGNRELYAMNADGTGQARLTSQAAVDFDPSWGEAFRRIGATAVGTPVTRVMQVENRGQWPLVVSDINFSFGDGQFEASPTSFNVNPGGSQEMAVTFNPTSVGAKYVFLNISSNAPGPPVRLMVNGTVASPNQPPVLTVPGAQEVDEGQTLSFNVSATDPDPGQTVTITAAGLPDGAAFSNGAFSWTPSLTQAGSYTVTFTAADDGSPNLSDGPKSVSIRVDDGVQVGSGITSNPLDAATGATPITLTFETVTQAGGSSLATSSSGPMPPANFSLSDPEIYYDLHTTAVFSGYIEVSIHYDEVAFDDESELRLFHFENDLWMDVTIALDTDADVITGRVTSLSPFAVFESENDPPVLILPGDQTADEGSALSFNVTAEDPDEGQTVTIVAQNLPEGAVFDGTIFTWTPSFTQAGNYTVSFTATDNGAPAKGDAKTVAIAVNNLNSAPLAAAGADQSVECVSHSGVQVALDGSQSSDLDGDELSYRWLENNRQIATGIEPTVTLGLGKHTITLVVKDGSLESQPDEATVTVQDTQPPTLTLNGSAQVTLECHVDTYTEEGAQASDACDPNPKVSISGSVDTQKLGNYTITYTAIDASGNSASVTRAVQVQDTAPPQVQAALERVQVRRDDEGDEEHRGNLFQVKVAATDRCDPNPQITALLSQPLSSGDQVDIRYKKQKKVEIQIHQGKKLQVRLRGPSERELRRLLEQALQAGGFVVSDGQMVRLHLQEQGHGDREDDEEEGGFKYRFDRQLKLMSASGRDLALRASATDASGNQSAVVEVIPPRQRLTKPVAGAEEEAALPPRFSLQPNYPNPFNPSTTLRYELDDLQEVRLSIYNVMGQEMWVLVDQARGPGRCEVEWGGRDALGHPVGAGIYLYRLQAGGSTQVRKMTLVK